MATSAALQALKVFGRQSFNHCKNINGLNKRFLFATEISIIRTCYTLNRQTNGNSDMKTFYKGRNVFITGVTGFVGKVLLEKLLRSCNEIGNVYILIRPKRGHSVKQRMEEMLNTKVFDRLKKERPAAIQKLIAIDGDVSKPNLGMSELDEKKLIDNVSVVFHSAATLKFNEELMVALTLNAGGVLNIVDLCKKIKDFKGMIYISTAYCNCNRLEVNEIVYPVTDKPVELVRAFQNGCITDEMAKVLQPILTKGQSNIYTYTKALSETLLLQESKNIPIAIVRPSIVVASWKEPIPGWVDSLFGSTGLQLGLMKGILRTVRLKREVTSDCVPVDICVNMVIAAAWYLAKNKPKEVAVYHCTSGDVRPVTWGQLLNIYNANARKYPANQVLWYPKTTAKRFRWHHEVCVWCFHYFPAICLDTIGRLIGKNPGLFKLHRKTHAVLAAFDDFTTTDWKFKVKNQWTIWDQMSDKDKEEFYFDMRKFDWETYCEQYSLGIKQYILKEDISTLPKARKNSTRMKYLRNLTYLLGVAGSGSLVAVAFNLF